ncbi:MAG: hypothetical protein ACLQPD_23300 [Desulfomonilaceae bacterium]
MEIDRKSSAEETPMIIELGDCRQRGATSKSSPKCVDVMVEIASEDAIGEEIKSCLTKNLEQTGCVNISHDRPDWVFSIICFEYGNLVEMSVVLRQLFRSTAPGTEMVQADGSDQATLRKGGWVYESLKYHGLHGVPKIALADFLKSLASDFTSQHLGILPQSLRKRK